MRLDSETYRELRLTLIARLRRKYSRWCRRLFWSQGAIQDWAEDMVQDGLTAAKRDIAKYKPELSSLTYWCWLKTNTKARNSLLKAEKDAELKAQLLLEPEPSYNPMEELLSIHEVESLLKVLKPEQTEALGLYYYGVEVEQIARIMGYERKTIYTLIDRGRKKLREEEARLRAEEEGWTRKPPEGLTGGGGPPPDRSSKIVPLAKHRQRRIP